MKRSFFYKMVLACPGILGAFLLSAVHAAVPDWWDATAQKGWITNMPDFYQHQFADPPANFTVPTPYPGNATGTQMVKWELVGGWCAGTALLDTTYYWNAQPAFNGLIQDQNITQANKWVTPMGNNIIYNTGATALFTAQPLPVAAVGVNAWFDTLGFGAAAATQGKGLAYANYVVVQSGDDKGKVMFNSIRPGAKFLQVPMISDNTMMRTATAFDIVKQQMVAAGNTVNVQLGGGTNTDPRLWWNLPRLGPAGKYHLVAAAGLDASTVTDTKGTGTIYIADPDSNKGSNGANAGVNNSNEWPGIAGKVPTVPADRKFGAPGSEGPVPIAPRDPQNPKLLNAGFDQFYGFLKLANDGFTVADSDHNAQDATDKVGRYVNTTITKLGVTSIIGTVKVGAAPLPGGGVETTFRFTNTILDPVNLVEIFPDQHVAPGPNFLSSDPFGYAASNGGQLFATSLLPGESDLLLLDTLGSSPVNGYDEFFHDSVTNDWLTFSTATLDPTNDVFYELQGVGVPEPSTIFLFGFGLIGVLRLRKKAKG